MSTLITFIQLSFGNLALAIRKRKKKIKGIQIEKEVTLSLFSDDIENPKDTTRKILNLISELYKVTGYRINIQKSATFLYTSNEITQREIKETILFTIASKTKKLKQRKQTKIPRINLPNETKDLYSKNYKILVKETTDDTNTQTGRNLLLFFFFCLKFGMIMEDLSV